MSSNFITRYKNFIIYGCALAMLLFLLKWMEYRMVIITHAFEWYVGSLAVLFTCLGIWLAVRLTKPKTQTVIVEKTVQVKATSTPAFTLNEREMKRLNISKRELEVLQLVGNGMGNQEIADTLYISPNTVKTHLSRLFEKLQVSRRTQAIETGRKLQLIP